MSKNIEKLYEKAMEQVVPDMLDEIISHDVIPIEREDDIICQSQEFISHKKNFAYLSFVGVAMAALFFLLQLNRTAVETRIFIDVNPSFEIQLNKKEQVTKVVGLNKHAQNILDQIDFADKNLDNTIKKLFDAIDGNGYFNKETAVLVSVQGKKEKVSQEMGRKVKKQIKGLCKNNGLKTLVYSQSIGLEKEIQEVAETYHISQGRSTFICNMAKKDSSWKIEKLASLTIDELVTSLKKKGVKVSDILEKNEKTEEISSTKSEIKTTPASHEKIKEEDGKQKTDEEKTTNKPSQAKQQPKNEKDGKTISNDEKNKDPKKTEKEKKEKGSSPSAKDTPNLEDNDIQRKEHEAEEEHFPAKPPNEKEKRPKKEKEEENGGDFDEHLDDGEKDRKENGDNERRDNGHGDNERRNDK